MYYRVASPYSGAELFMQYHPEIINHTKIDDGYTPLHVAAQVDHVDLLCYLAAMVCVCVSVNCLKEI